MQHITEIEHHHGIPVLTQLAAATVVQRTFEVGHQHRRAVLGMPLHPCVVDDSRDVLGGGLAAARRAEQQQVVIRRIDHPVFAVFAD